MILDPIKLKDMAVTRTGLSAFGTAPLDEGLAIYCAALAHEAELSEHGMMVAAESIISTLSERLQVEDALSRNPAILDRPLGSLLMIVGIPRTGTTALSQYIAEDPRARSILRWEARELVRQHAGPNHTEDPRIERARASFATRNREQPWLQSVLPVDYNDPAEHGPMLGLTFLNLQLPVRYHVPSYATWLSEQDLTPAYRYLEKVLKLLQSQSPGQFWNLKNPPDLFALDVIHKVFPDARFIWTHRDPVDSIGSVCSLAAALRRSAGAAVSERGIGDSLSSFWATGVQRAMQARERMGEDRFFDINQRDLSAAGISTIQCLYADLDIPFSQEYRVKLERRLFEKPAGRHGKHSYVLSDFGLDPTALRGKFAAYIDRFAGP